MDSLSKLDTPTRETFPTSARNSFASTTEYNPSSARNSYTSISEASSPSSRSSYSSLKDSFGRVQSFPKTADAFHLGSVENTLIRSKDSSPASRWESKGPTKMSDQKSETDKSSQPDTKPKTKDGPTALKELENVKTIMCVAFGAFDRYYISWEDNEGKFHQVSQNLPKCLNKWLYNPEDGSTRDLSSLQVAFGSNDEFFASDDNGKLSSRDQCCQEAKTKPVSRLAEIARGMMRKKSNSISSATTPRDMPAQLESTPMSPRLQRRKALQLGQQDSQEEPRQTITPIGNRSQLTRWESKPDSSRAEKRRSLLSMPARTPTSEWVPEMPMEEPTPSFLVGVSAQRQSVELEPEVPKEETRGTFMGRVLLTPSADLKPKLFKEESRGGLFAGMLRRNPPPPEPPKEGIRTSFVGMLREPVIEVKPEQSQEIQSKNGIEPPPAKPVVQMRSPFNEQLQPAGLDVQLELQKAEERRSLLHNVPPMRPSWPERKTLQRLSTLQGMAPVRSNYADASVQTEIVEAEIGTPLKTLDVPVFIPPPHAVSIGSMSDFFRGQYQLGDALRYV